MCVAWGSGDTSLRTPLTSEDCTPISWTFFSVNLIAPTPDGCILVMRVWEKALIRASRCVLSEMLVPICIGAYGSKVVFWPFLTNGTS